VSTPECGGVDELHKNRRFSPVALRIFIISFNWSLSRTHYIFLNQSRSKILLCEREKRFFHLLTRQIWFFRAEVSVSFLVKVGTAHENSGERGFSRLLSQLAFRKSAAFADGEVGQFLFDATGIKETKFHVAVDFEHTVFSVAVPCDDSSNKGFTAFTKVTQWLASIIGSLQFDDKILKEEIASLLSDVEQEKESGSAAQAAQATRLALEGTPFATRQLRGNAGDVASATLEKVKAFYQRFYHPKNAGIVVCGDFNKYTIALDVINKHLAAVPAAASAKVNVPLTFNSMKLNNGPIYSISRDAQTPARILIEFRASQGDTSANLNTMGFLQSVLADEVARGFLRQRVAAIAAKLALEEPVVNDKLIGSAFALVEVAFTAPQGAELAAFSRVVEEVERAPFC
jgi:zinc protease